MGKLKDDSNIQIYGWMATKLKLKGNELLIYAVIYSFSRNDNGNGVFNASISYLQEWTGLTRANVIGCISRLITKNLVVKLEDNSQKRKPNVYVVNKSIFDNMTSIKTVQALVSKEYMTCTETIQALVPKQYMTSTKTIHNNTQ